MTFIQQLKNFDRQLFLYFDPRRQRWVVMRMGERFGEPRASLSHGEIRLAKETGAVSEVLVCQDNDGCPMEPSWWIIDYLRQRDTRRINMRQFVRELDDRNDKLREKARADSTDRLAYGVRENWRHIRDELRQDTGHRKSTWKPS